MNIDIINSLLAAKGAKQPFVSGVLVEREVDLNSHGMISRIIILTDRALNIRGGDGVYGISNDDIMHLRDALNSAFLEEERGSGFIKSFVIRERRSYPAGYYHQI